MSGDDQGDGRRHEREAFINALQVLVLVAGAAVKRLRNDDQRNICRQVVAAAARVLELTPQVLPPVPIFAMRAKTSNEKRAADDADRLRQRVPHAQLK
jgi:hypothetical protein